MPTFREYSKDYFDGYRKPDGSKLSGRSNRCNEIVLRRLNEAFGDTPLDRMVVPEFLRTLVFARPRGDDQFADCTFSPSLDMSR